ncbi:MAG TPA: hypothetical protein DCY13_07615, partial [Verrucomicrobiales bacterium]|nr:hypothetical protein [Verrucomicrobiales bacterium]
MPHRLKLYSAALGLFAIFTWVIWIRPPADGTSAVVARAQVGTPMAPAPVAPINTPALVVEEANGSSVKPSTMGSVASDSQPSNSTFAAISDFAIWSERYLAADGSERRSMASRGIALARERRAALRELIQKDPESALNAAAPWELRRVLPPEFHQFLEQPVNALAQYGVTVASDFENQTRQVSRRAVIGGRSYHAFVYGSMSVAGSSPNLPVNGIAIDDALALAETATRVLSPAEAAAAKAALTSADPVCTVSGEPADHRGDETLVEIASELQFVCGADHVRTLQELAAEAAKQGKGWKGTGGGPETLDSWNQGPKRLLFIRVNFPDDLAEPISASAAYELMNNVNTWLVANSYDSTSMITTVTPLLTLPYTKAFYSEVGDGQLLTDARAVAKAAGYDTADFELDAVRFTNVPGYSYGGKAYVRGKGCWLQSSSVGVACHEFGHNYGLWHANYWNGSGASGIGPGSHSEYGDSFDTMGSASAGDKHFSAIHRNIIDWLGDSYVREVTANGTYRLHAVDVPGLLPGRFNALKLYKDFDRDYWVELRHLFAGNSSIQNGVLLRWDPWAASAGGAHLLDATPGSPAGSSSKDDAALVVGRTFADPGAGLFITPVALHGTGAGKSVDVVVNRGSFAANQRPTVSVQAEKTQAATGESVTFTATANDPDGDVLAYDWDFGDLTFGINGPLVTNLWSASGDYVVRCRVSDMKGGWASAHVVVRIGSHSTFSIRGRVTDTLGQPIEGVRVHNGSISSSS